MRPWRIFAVLAALLALRTLYDWTAVVLSGLPTGYGEGAVAHAGQILSRGGDPYGPAPPGTFVSANYPPLAYAVLAGGQILGPFTALRIANVAASLAVAAVIAWQARAETGVAISLAGSFVVLFPVAEWVSGARVDPLAVSFAALAIVVASADPRRAALSGALAALAIAAKPTAAVPLLVVFAYLLYRNRPAAFRVGVASAVAIATVTLVVLLRFDRAGLWDHLVLFNAFPYDPRNPLLLAVIAILTMGAFIAVAFRVGDGRMRAYLAGAIGVVALGGHEGATINYLLDLAAASCLALAPAARALSPRVAALFSGQLLATALLVTLGPFAGPSLSIERDRVDLTRAVAATGPVYAEDSGILVAAQVEPIVDDPYVWARLLALGALRDSVTPRVSERGFAAILSDVELERIDQASHVEQQRWPAQLLTAVRERYRLDRHESTLWVYVPR